MPELRQHSRPPKRHGALSLCAPLCLLLAGCVLPGGKGSSVAWAPGWLRPEPPAVLSPDVTCEQLITHLNRDIERIQSWRSTDASIQTRGPGGVPVRLSAQIAVESPRRFRLRATLPIGGDEADFGSNDDRFWFWMRRGGQYVMTASYEDLPLVQSRLNLPFQPDWLVEALGAVPLDPRRYTLDRSGTDEETVQLVGERRLPDGRPVRQSIRVDTRRGVITEHSLHDVEGRVLAQASFKDHRADRQTGAMLPRRIDLYWPQMKQTMALHLGSVEVNPENIPERMWDLPHIPGCPTFDMAARLRRNQSSFAQRERPRPTVPMPASPPAFEEDAWMGQAARETPPWDTSPEFEDEAPDFEEEPRKRRSPIWPVQGLFSRN